MARILVIDDDRALLRALEIALTARGHEVAMARTAAGGISQASLVSPDVVVLDLGLPDLDGVEVVRRLRQWTQVPVIVLSAAASEPRKVTALDAGADDYVTKPFGMAELEARLRVALRRRADGAADEPASIGVGKLEVDLVHHMARLGGKDLDLTRREFDLLAYLARHSGKVCTHQMILHDVWGSAYGAEAHYLRVYAHRLRRKLGDAGDMLRTQPGIGYQLVDDSG
ncbi:MAG: response regulator transcription factor [Actinomycetota bacterium]|jgi:two-component system KDP operon response regulator KdpE|nr:response regulator transcription factor [Actinomycetota bacterium]